MRRVVGGHAGQESEFVYFVANETYFHRNGCRVRTTVECEVAPSRRPPLELNQVDPDEPISPLKPRDADGRAGFASDDSHGDPG